MVLTLRVTVTSPVAISFRRGSTRSRKMACISTGGPGMMTMILPSRSAHQPGAVPLRLGMNSAEGISQACLTLCEGMFCPRLRKYCRSSWTMSSWTLGVSPKAAATASRVRSSCVGPSPPVVKMMSERSSPIWKACVSCARSSPTSVTHCSVIPNGGSRVAIQPALVSLSSPMSSSVPIPMISAFISSLQDGHNLKVEIKQMQGRTAVRPVEDNRFTEFSCPKVPLLIPRSVPVAPNRGG